MTTMNPQIEFLYSCESAAEYQASCETIFRKYEPKTAEESNIVSHIAIATWLRHRFAQTMHSLLRKIQSEEIQEQPDYAQIARIGRSMVRFHREYRQQKKAISGCRVALRRLRNNNSIDAVSAFQQEYSDVRLAA